MKLSSGARYVMRMMLEIARNDSDQTVSLTHISKRTHISRRYLEQLVQSLKQASLVRGVSGRGGGYQLTRPAGEILLLDIIEAVVGPISIVDCVQHPKICIKSDVCECRWIYALINKKITEVLGEVTLADLLDKGPLMSTCENLMAGGFSCPTR